MAAEPVRRTRRLRTGGRDLSPGPRDVIEMGVRPPDASSRAKRAGDDLQELRSVDPGARLPGGDRLALAARHDALRYRGADAHALDQAVRYRQHPSAPRRTFDRPGRLLPSAARAQTQTGAHSEAPSVLRCRAPG